MLVLRVKVKLRRNKQGCAMKKIMIGGMIMALSMSLASMDVASQKIVTDIKSSAAMEEVNLKQEVKTVESKVEDRILNKPAKKTCCDTCARCCCVGGTCSKESCILTEVWCLFMLYRLRYGNKSFFLYF